MSVVGPAAKEMPGFPIGVFKVRGEGLVAPGAGPARDLVFFRRYKGLISGWFRASYGVP